MLKNLELIQNLVDRIETNLAEEVSIVSLSKSFGISPWHFQRSFKSLIGDTLGGYVRGRRLTHAARLLLDTQLSIIDIAFSVGFNSHEAFTRSFNAYFQQSPRAFRQNKPAVLLREKPLLTPELVEHLTLGMRQEPVIITRPAQTIAGYTAEIPSPFISNENYCELLYTPWTTLLASEKNLDVSVRGTYYGLTVSPSGNFTEDTLDYIAGVPVTANDYVEDSMVIYDFPEQLVAEFEVFAGTDNTVSKTIDYIYGYWLPNSGYARGDGDDYELFENVISFEDPDLRSKYVIPLRTDS